MSNLTLVLYLSDIAKNLQILLGIVLFACVAAGIFAIVFLMAEADCGSADGVNRYKKGLKYIAAVTVLAAVVIVAIPSKTVFYTYIATELAGSAKENIIKDPRFEKIITLLDRKLDEVLNDTEGK